MPTNLLAPIYGWFTEGFDTARICEGPRRGLRRWHNATPARTRLPSFHDARYACRKVTEV